MLKKDKIILEKYNGVHPTCECGCGEQTRYEAKLKDYCRFISGHQSRLKGHWGDLKSEKRVNAIKKTRKEKFASGEYDHILKQVSKPRSEETIDKISKSGKGISRPKKNGFGVGRIQSTETRMKMSNSHKQNWENGNIGNRKHYTSKLEDKFEMILIELKLLNYAKFFKPKTINAFYDFVFPEEKIIIEVDGDFWHTNPKKYPNGPICYSQEQNQIKDKIKNQWALDNGYKILRFWENDINNNIQEIKRILLEALS